ncbi:MAG: hypothetical protein NC184_07155 [Roseburia sp.]|nr:hypothetical protein [Roseburia sp.]
MNGIKETRRIRSIIKKYCFCALLCVSLLLSGCQKEDVDDCAAPQIVLGELNYYDAIKLPKGDMSDHTFVGDELWVFFVSNEEHTEYSDIHRYKVDIPNNDYEYIGKISHNLGHCNTVDYCRENDTLILGNGGNINYDLQGQIYIINNVSELKERNDITFNDVAKIIDLDDPWGGEFGWQVNVCWGESNQGDHNIIYVISNRDNVKYIRKILLGVGQNQLQYGKFAAVGDKEFNGTFKILSEYHQDYSTLYCNQGTQYYGGKLYEALGHDGVLIAVDSLLESGDVKTEYLKTYYYREDGEISPSTFSEGIAIKDGYLFAGQYDYYFGSKILIYQL